MDPSSMSLWGPGQLPGISERQWKLAIKDVELKTKHTTWILIPMLSLTAV